MNSLQQASLETEVNLANMWILVLLFCKVFMDGRCLGYSPVNTAVVAGKPMVMMCGVHPNKTMYVSTVEWKFQSFGNTQTELLFNGYNLPNRESGLFMRNDSEGEFNLWKNRSHLRDAGAYHCIKRIHDGLSLRTETKIAQLTILESEPNCGSNARNGSVVEGDQLRIWCSVNYSGNLDPVMEWSMNDGSIVDSTVSYSTDTFPRTVISTSHQTMNFDEYKVVYFCKTYFKAQIVDSQKEGSSTATNAPDYKAECKLTVDFVFGPRNLSITPRKNVYMKGDHLRCSASSNPPSTYKWMEVGTEHVANGPYLTIDETMEQKQITSYLCKAENIVNGEEKSASGMITIKVKETVLDSSTSIRLTLIVGSGAVGFGIVITVMGFILWKLAKRKCCAHNSQHGSDERRRSPYDYESVKSDDLQPSPDIELDQSSTIDQSTTEAEMVTTFAESNLQYSSLGDRPVVQEPQPYSSLEVTNSDEQSIQRSRLETPNSYINVEIQPTDSGEHFTQTYKGKGRPHNYYNVKIETAVSVQS